MKKSNVGLLLYIVGLVTAIITTASCVSKHPKCAAYDKVDSNPMFKTNLERSLYK